MNARPIDTAQRELHNRMHMWLRECVLAGVSRGDLRAWLTDSCGVQPGRFQAGTRPYAEQVARNGIRAWRLEASKRWRLTGDERARVELAVRLEVLG